MFLTSYLHQFEDLSLYVIGEHGNYLQAHSLRVDTAAVKAKVDSNKEMLKFELPSLPRLSTTHNLRSTHYGT